MMCIAGWIQDSTCYIKVDGSNRVGEKLFLNEISTDSTGIEHTDEY